MDGTSRDSATRTATCTFATSTGTTGSGTGTTTISTTTGTPRTPQRSPPEASFRPRDISWGCLFHELSVPSAEHLSDFFEFFR
jgi:hypothetical protein